VYVFYEPASGWQNATQTAELTASDGGSGDMLGSSLAMSGATIAAGAANHTVAGKSRQGAVYVFSEPASGWQKATQTAELTASDGVAGDELGGSVAIFGATIAAGSRGLRQTGGAGAAYVFSQPGSGWQNASQTAELSSSTGLGSVAVSGSTIAAGTVSSNRGSVDVFGTPAVHVKPPPPVLGKSVDVAPVSGTVFVRLPRGRSSAAAGRGRSAAAAGGRRATAAAVSKGPGFVPLTAARQLPSGSEIDARAGSLTLTAASTRRGTVQTGVFGGAVIQAQQAGKSVGKGLTTLTLLEGAFRGAPSYSVCGTRAAGHRLGRSAAAAKLSPRVLQTLRAHVHGHFRSKGRYSAATVRGTVWDTTDRCDGTLTVVHQGTVDVDDFARHKTVVVHAGHRYLAAAPRARHT
jgi:hypothetical protein